MLGIAIIVSVVLGIVMGYLFCIMPRVFGRPDVSGLRGAEFAHRGLHDGGVCRPENSMSAFMAAVECGYAIELDVQKTKDSKVVVFHDFDLKRVCGVEGRVSDFTYEQLKRYPLLVAGEGVHKEEIPEEVIPEEVIPEEVIPLFTDVLELVAGKVPILVELKYNKDNLDIAALVYQILKNYKGVYYIQCFHMEPLRWYRKKQPKVLLGQLAMGVSKKKKGMQKVIGFFQQHLLGNFISRPDFISYSWRRSNELSLHICKRIFGSPVIVWTLRNGKEVCEAKKRFDGVVFEKREK